MKLSRRTAIPLIIGGGIGIALAGSYFIKQLNKKEETDEYITGRQGTEEQKQIALNKAFSLLKPESLSEAIYDPELKQTKIYLENRIRFLTTNEEELQKTLEKKCKEFEEYDMIVIGILIYSGNGQKRPLFARNKIFESSFLKHIQDLKNILRYPNEQARHEKEGYDFGDRTIKGEELTYLISKEKIRHPVIQSLIRFSSYLSQWDAIIGQKDSVSDENRQNVRQNIANGYDVCKKGLKKEAFTSLEEDYVNSRLEKNKEIIKAALS